MDRTTASNDKYAIPLSKKEVARIEVRNAIGQFDWAIGRIESGLEEQSYNLDLSQLLILNLLAVNGIRVDAGRLRVYSVGIRNSPHKPPPQDEVPGLVDEMLAYVNTNWDRSALHLAAYLLWRVNWIHPFGEGNGRTSRMVAYMILSIRLGFLLPGTRTIPDLIAGDRKTYYDALSAADQMAVEGKIDVSQMEALVEQLLAEQLADLIDEAGRNGKQTTQDK